MAPLQRGIHIGESSSAPRWSSATSAPFGDEAFECIFGPAGFEAYFGSQLRCNSGAEVYLGALLDSPMSKPLGDEAFERMFGCVGLRRILTSQLGCNDGSRSPTQTKITIILINIQKLCSDTLAFIGHR
ncbi:hypothetical protein Tco_1538924 [Tanacetum coccineum]